MTQTEKDIANLKPRILRAAGEITGVLKPVQSYYTPFERMQEYAHIWNVRIGGGVDRDIDCVIRLYREYQDDPEDKGNMEALAEAVEAAIEAAESARAEYPEEP